MTGGRQAIKKWILMKTELTTEGFLANMLGDKVFLRQKKSLQSVMIMLLELYIIESGLATNHSHKYNG